jgi:ATP-dependent exoDNAse (exonuclease V) beta subunit
VKDVAPEVLHAGLMRYRKWSEARDAAIDHGKTPSIDVRTATEWTLRDDRSPEGLRHDTNVESIAFDGDATRPAGTRYGTLVHAALATLPLTADPDTIRRVVETQGRIVGATDEEVASAANVARAVLSHPVFDGARAAEARQAMVLRETPITLRVDDALVEGVADLVFEDERGCVVVDFKTDRASGEWLARYRRQIALYAEAVARATGKPTRAILMSV